MELCRQRCEEIAGHKKKLDEMKGVLSKYKSKEGEAGFGGGFGAGALQARIEQLQADIEAVNAELHAAEGKAKAAREGNVEQLEEKVLAEQEKLGQLTSKLASSDTLMMAGTSPKEALEEAGRFKKKYEAAAVELGRLQNYQQALGLKAERAAELAEFEAKFAVRERLWSIRKAFGEE